MPKFTVVGYYESTSEVFAAHVEAENEVAAVQKVPEELKVEPEDLMLVGIFKGHIRDQNECSTISSIADWPKEEPCQDTE